MTRPIRILELRSVRGTGGGPEKTILLGAARSDPNRFAVTVCYLRDARDAVFSIDTKAGGLPVDYVEILEQHSFDRTVWPRLRQLVRDRHIDVVHAHEYKTDVLAWMLARAEGVSALATVHGWTGHSARERWLYYPVDKRVLALYPRLVAVSNDIRQELIRYGARPERVTTILNGIDHRAFRRDPAQAAAVRAELGLMAEDMVIGDVGRLEPQKRFDVLIDAVAKLKPGYPRVKLLIAGDGSLREALSAQIARLGLEDTCWLLGHQSDIPRLHHAFDLFVQSSDYEGTPNSVLEAMALETPVVATDVGGTAELIQDGTDGLIVPPGNVPALAHAIERSLNDPGARRSWALAARHRVETDLSFATRMTKLEAIYTELFEKRSGAGTAAVLPVRT